MLATACALLAAAWAVAPGTECHAGRCIYDACPLGGCVFGDCFGGACTYPSCAAGNCSFGNCHGGGAKKPEPGAPTRRNEPGARLVSQQAA